MALAVVMVGLLAIRLLLGVQAGQGASVVLGLVLGALVIGGVFTVVPATMARQLSRVRASSGPDVQAWRVIDPQRSLASRFLLVSPAHGWARLVDKRGQRLAEWNGSTFARVEEKPICPSGSLVARPGLSLHASDGSATEMLLPSRTTLRYPARYRDEAMSALAAAFGPSKAER